MPDNTISYLKHGEIDQQQWDTQIAATVNARPYAYSWYLNIVSPGWEALVSKEPGLWFPLPRACKMGFCYLRQPRFAQQLGLFSAHQLQGDETASLIQAIPKHFQLIDLQLHSETVIPDSLQAVITARPNYLLALHPSYNTLWQGYSSNTQRNIKKARKEALFFTANADSQDFVEFKSRYAANLRPADFRRLRQLLEEGLKREQIQLYTVTGAKGQWLSSAAFLLGNRRRIMINNGSSPEGKQRRAMFFLLDSLIQHWAGSDLLLDFEGSSIPGVARFFSGFGAKPEYYSHLYLHRNKWMKTITSLRHQLSRNFSRIF